MESLLQRKIVDGCKDIAVLVAKCWGVSSVSDRSIRRYMTRHKDRLPTNTRSNGRIWAFDDEVISWALSECVGEGAVTNGHKRSRADRLL